MPDLLEYLSDTLHCVYLSDLHYVTVTPEQAAALLDLPDQPFSLEDYHHALDYLTGSHEVSSLDAARQALKDTLTRPK